MYIGAYCINLLNNISAKKVSTFLHRWVLFALTIPANDSL